MARFKTALFWIFVILASGAGLYAYFHLKNNKKPQHEALSVLPDQCLFYLNSPDFFELNKKINSQSLIADKLKLFGEIDAFCDVLHSFDSLCNSNEDIREVIRNNRIHFACYNEKQSWIAVFNLKQLGEQDDITEQLSKLLKANGSKADIYAFSLRGVPMYFNLTDGVVGISNRQELIIRCLDKKQARLYANKDFQQFKSTLTENGLLNMYVNHTLYTQNKIVSRLNLSYFNKKGASAGSIDLQPSQIKINGYTEPGEDETLSFFRDQKPQSCEDLVSQLPLNTSFFKAFGFSDFPELKISFPLTNIHIKYWMKATERGLYNVEEDFYANLSGRIVAFETYLPTRRYLLAEVSDTIKAAEHLKFMSDSVLKQEGFSVYRLNDSIKPLQLFIALSDHHTNYAFVFQSTIFFGDKVEELLALAASLRSGHNLEQDERFAAYRNQNFPDEFNYLIYCAPNKMIPEIPAFFDFKSIAVDKPFENFRHFSFSASQHENSFKFRLQLSNETSDPNKEQNALWTLHLNGSASTTACRFVNHISGENEIVIQDDYNKLYLINAKGTILWEKQLNEKILSTIYIVDTYKKNKYQLLFNTKNYLHLIDRNGNYLKNYPVKLPAEATSPLSVFDYDEDKDYRLFIACKNRNIYNFSIHGAPQEKFGTVRTEDEVDLPIQYVKVGSSDYLVALDKEGKIYTFSRKGAGRIGLKNRTVVNCKAFYTDAGNSIANTYLIYVDDKSGLLNKISFEDKKEIVKLHSEPENGMINFSLIDDNRSMDLIVTNHNSFQAYNFSGNLITEKSFDLPLYATNFFGDESHSVFCSLSEDRTQLTVFDQLQSKTKVYKANALPLISDLFNDGKKYLILTNGDEMSCVLLK